MKRHKEASVKDLCKKEGKLSGGMKNADKPPERFRPSHFTVLSL